MNHFFESTRDKRTKVRDGKGGEEGDSSGNFIRVTSTVGQTTRYQASRMSTVRVPFPFPIANGSSRFFATPLDLPYGYRQRDVSCILANRSEQISDPRKRSKETITQDSTQDRSFAIET